MKKMKIPMVAATVASVLLFGSALYASNNISFTLENSNIEAKNPDDPYGLQLSSGSSKSDDYCSWKEVNLLPGAEKEVTLKNLGDNCPVDFQYISSCGTDDSCIKDCTNSSTSIQINSDGKVTRIEGATNVLYIDDVELQEGNNIGGNTIIGKCNNE